MKNELIDLLLNESVTHKKFGLGTIVDIRLTTKEDSIDYYIDVEFEKVMRTFILSGIGKYFIIEDEKLSDKISGLLEEQSKEYRLNMKKEEEEREMNSLFNNYNDAYLSEGKSIAFKCAYCDGGASKDCIGFKGICSENRKRINCSGLVPAPFCPYSLCNGDGRIMPSGEPGLVCYESRMLIDWKCYAGLDKETATPRKISCARNNYVAFLATKLPDFDEWVIFAAFLITRSFEGNDKYEGFVECNNEDYRVELTPEEAKSVKYWDFYKNKDGSQQWTGLFRYFENDLTLKVLNHMLKVIKETSKKEKVNNIIREFKKVI